MFNGTIGNRALYDALLNSFKGEVKGVFSGGIYIFAENNAIMLHDSSFGVLPFGIALDDFNGRGRELGLESGMTAEVSDGVLRVPGHEIRLSYRECVCLSTPIEFIETFISEAGRFLSSSDKCTLWMYSHFGRITAEKDDIRDIFASAAYSGMVMFDSAMEENDSDKLSASLMKLLGLGRGLTPSCDDYITGVLFMLAYGEKAWGIVFPQRKTLAECVRRLADTRTNIYSALYLNSAAAGGDFSSMRECLEHPCGDSVSKLGEVGSSSGTDMLCGMLYAAEMINRMLKK